MDAPRMSVTLRSFPEWGFAQPFFNAPPDLIDLARRPVHKN